MTLKILPLLVVLSLGVSAASAQVPEEALQCFRWFSTLGYPEVKEARWAEVWTGSYFDPGENGGPAAHTLMGFVTSETDKEFTIMKADLIQRKLRKTKPGTPAHMQVTYAERPFLPMIGRQLALLPNPPESSFRGFEVRLGRKAEVFFLAHACWQKGEDALAAQLYAQAEKLGTPRQLPDAQAGNGQRISMQEALEIELGHAAMWDAVLRCGGGSLGGGSWMGGDGSLEPLTSVVEAFRRVVRLFPRCEHIERARQSIAMLERLIEEDKKHVTLSQEQIDKLPLDQRIAELIWLLRDQNGHQYMQPGRCDVFNMSETGTSPAHQLLAIGDAAAPALIEALTDGRFSRSVGFHRNFHFSHTILTVGDCAQQILNRMTGQNFYSPASTSGYMSNEDKMREVQKAAQKWWKDYQQKGKKQMLVDSIAAAKTPPGQLVEQLQKEAPDAVEAALLRGADNAQTEWLARQFVDALAGLKTPQASHRLVRFMKEHPKREVRLDAAGRLLNENHDQALPAILREWAAFSAADHREERGDFERLVILLVATGDTEAMKRLVERWEARPVPQRFEIVRKLGEWLGDPANSQTFTSVKARPASAEAKAAGIGLLARALEDTDARDGTGGSIGDFKYDNPRICDFALWSLHEIDPKKYAFSPRAERRQRDAERITAANLWRKEHDLPLLPPPPPPGPKLAAKDALQIVEVRIKPEKDFADTPLVRRALALRGGVFGPDTLSSLLRDFARQPPPGASGLRVEAVREADLTGVELCLSLSRGEIPTDKGKYWGTMSHGLIGTHNLGSAGGSAALSHLQADDGWDDFEKDIRDGMKALPATTAFTLCAGLRAP